MRVRQAGRRYALPLLAGLLFGSLLGNGGCAALRGRVDTDVVRLALDAGCSSLVARLVAELDAWNGTGVRATCEGDSCLILEFRGERAENGVQGAP